MQYDLSVGFMEMIAAAALVASHPITRLSLRWLAIVGHLSSFYLLLRTSKTARRVCILVAVVIALVVTSGCSSTTTTSTGRTVATTAANPVTGVYCLPELEAYQVELKKYLHCGSATVCSNELLANSQLKYDNCVADETSDVFLVNPFNRIRKL